MVVDPEAALEDGAPLIHEDFGTNKSYTFSLGGGDLDAGFAEADVIIERRVVKPPHRRARPSRRAAPSPSGRTTT